MSASMDIMSLISCGQDLNSITKGKTQLGEDIKTVVNKAALRCLAPFPFWNIPFIGQYLDGGGWYVNRERRRLIEIVDENKKSLIASDSKSGATSNGTPAQWICDVTSNFEKQDADQSTPRGYNDSFTALYV
jgi:hypothetical protein